MNDKALAPVQNGHHAPSLIFADGQCLLSMVTAGTLHERLISWETVRQAALEIPVDSGWLAPEIVRHGTGMMGDWAVAFLPPGRRTLEITAGVPGPDETTNRIEIPLPGIVVLGIGVTYWAWAQQGPRFSPEAPLFRCPLPNVGAGAWLCYGVLKPPQANPRSILKAWETFATSTFNNHYADHKSKRYPEDIRELLRELARDPAVTYPVEDMEPSTTRLDRPRKLGDLLNELFDSGGAKMGGWINPKTARQFAMDGIDLDELIAMEQI